MEAIGLTKGQQHVTALREKIEMLKGQLSSSNLSNEAKTVIGTEIHGLENQQLGLEFDESQKSAKQRARERIQQEKFERFVQERATTGGLKNIHRGMRGEIISGVDPFAPAPPGGRHLGLNGKPIKSQAYSGPGGPGGPDAGIGSTGLDKTPHDHSEANWI
jgi:hypothetical protein